MKLLKKHAQKFFQFYSFWRNSQIFLSKLTNYHDLYFWTKNVCSFQWYWSEFSILDRSKEIAEFEEKKTSGWWDNIIYKYHYVSNARLILLAQHPSPEIQISSCRCINNRRLRSMLLKKSTFFPFRTTNKDDWLWGMFFWEFNKKL